MAFRLFPRLPTELRQQIWNAALPREIGQTLYCYKTGCWEPRQLTEVDEGFEPTHETNLYLTFQEELLDPVLFEIPLLFVNREARIVAQQWLTRHGIDSYQSKDDHSIVFACRFNTDRDSLYVDHDALSYFIVEPGEREFALDLTGKPLMFSPASVKHLALPVTVFLPEMGYELVYVLEEFYSHIQEIWMVVWPLPDFQPLSSLKQNVNRRWEVDPTRNETACQQVYNEALDGDNKEAIRKVTVQDLVQRVKVEINRATNGQLFKDLVIRPVVALRK
ncbi:MAG: hypothetical protein GOMPHAMPRED_004831 [Gomphillus americanus]|uniref:2EXR domain-containing protein n=1 Tax=Gomphillus americanus TaxID=1940652 RepID=A0A8H3EH45_9LECA|nr:MAG: hypothetical protein GOMPHAMPRED_004831 [Gomphillus americanus]